LPKTSCFLSLFLPDKFIAYDAESAPAYDYLVNTKNTAPKRGWNYFLFNQKLYTEVRSFLRQSTLEVSFFKELLDTEDLSTSHWGWITQDFLLFVNREVKEKVTVPAYYCVGFNYNEHEPESQLPRFIKDGIWENGYEDKFLDIVKNVPIGSLIAAKTAYTMSGGQGMVSVLEVHTIGVVSENIGDGKTLVVKWKSDFESFKLKGKGAYRSTISQVQDQENIDLIFYQSKDAEMNSEKGLTNQNGSEPINTILYGPPGTGKTYKLRNEYFPKYTSKLETLSKEDYLDDLALNLTWWESIALGILDLGPTDVSTLKDHPVVKAKAKFSNSSNIRPTLWGRLQSHTVAECEFVNVSDRSQPQIFSKTKDSIWSIDKDLLNAYNPELLLMQNSISNFKPSQDKEVERYVFTTFHQSLSYEDFIEGIKPVMDDEEALSSIKYEIKPGIFKQICTRARIDPENRYAIFIDEINRGNVSAIFGELITLIESDKREGMPNAMSAQLPYSKQDFSVPANLDVYGTMNTADRSVEALDSALRRRFSFEELRPNADVLTQIDENATDVEGVNLVELLKTINERIELLLDKDHQIGHSYFIGVRSVAMLLDVFTDKVFPLLEEYFFGDIAKIGLVVGGAFLKETDKKDKVHLAANFAYEEKNLLTEKKVYQFTEKDTWTAGAFISIYNPAKES
jgi:5-methylcytosine-specific restriction protein B